MTEPERDALVKRLEEAVAALGEHFEAVQVHVSTWNETGTWTISRGYGNWNARQGVAHAFVSQNAANEQAESIAHALNNE